MAKRGVINPTIGVTDANLRSQIRSAIRKVWRNSSRRVFLESIRFPYGGKSGKGKYGVKCVSCGRVMGYSEKEHVALKNGKLSKKPKLAYQVDHITDPPAFLTMADLSGYAEALIYADLRILCFKCHADKTHGATKEDKQMEMI